MPGVVRHADHPLFFMTATPQQFDLFKRIIDPARRIVLTTHLNPDGDGIGSELALAAYLTESGKDVNILNHSATPDFYQFLDSGNTVRQFDPSAHARIIKEADVIIIVDTNHPDRIADLRDHVLESPAKKIVIDHHLDPHPFADLSVIDDSCAATGEIIFRLLEHLGASPLSPSAATALYAAIMTDTGSFRYPKTDGELHRIVAKLLDCGVDPVETYRQIYDQAPLNRIVLLGKALSTLETFHDGRVAVIAVDRNLFHQTGTTESDVERFVPFAMGIKGVQIGLLFVELQDHVKISFRSLGDIWVNRLAQEFGGNGHKNAAGARVNSTTLKDLKKSVVDRSHHYLL